MHPLLAPTSLRSLRPSRPMSSDTDMQFPDLLAPKYPMEIPPEKRKRARELYGIYTMTPKNGDVRVPSIAGSVTPQTSSKQRATPSEIYEESMDGEKAVKIPKAGRTLADDLRAKAALIRCLGACELCRARKVPVSNPLSRAARRE